MGEVKWIKITTNIFDDEKIRVIETMPEGDTIIVIWFKLLCLAGKSNNNGYLNINKTIFFDIDTLKKYFSKYDYILDRALSIFVKYKMVDFDENKIKINNWYDFIDNYNRTTKEYKEWRKKVLERDNFTCQKCNKTNVMLHAHHIKSYKDYINLRLDVKNGITLCVDCHKEVHKNGTKKNV